MLVTCAAKNTQAPNRTTSTTFSTMPVSGAATPMRDDTANIASMRIKKTLASRMSVTISRGYAVR